MVRLRLPAVTACLVVLACGQVFAQSPGMRKAPEPEPVVEELGGERYRIDSIVVDRAAGRFTVPGRILHLDKPLEYLAVTETGDKGYESLLALETTALAFKLACILIGADAERAVTPEYQFDQQELDGDRVALTIGWEDGGEKVEIPADDALASAGEPFDRDAWVYIGSMIVERYGGFLASVSGTLIGFVHDPVAIIEHRYGIGIGAYGSITGNAEVLPPEGAPVTLSVSLQARTGGEADETEQGE